MKNILKLLLVIVITLALFCPLNVLGDESNIQIDPFAFFTGKVTQSYSQDQSAIEAMDLTQYIDRDNKLIKSITDELEWDYANGVVKIDTPKSQGAFGFLNKYNTIELRDIIIQSTNEYITILVISLDDKPINDSSKILIQAMTEDKPYGWSVENDTIQSLGGYPINVKNIEATVTFKGKDNINKISVLNEKGYIKNQLTVSDENGNIKIILPSDSLYTIVE